MQNKWGDTIRNFPTHIVTVGGLVESAEGKILMVKHPVRGWKMPGGQVKRGETISEAFKREIKEETGIDIEAGTLVSVSSNIGIGVQYDGVSTIPTVVTFKFTGNTISGELTTSEESFEVSWVNRNQVLNLIDEDFTRDRRRYMLNYDGRITYFIFSRNPYIIYGVQYLQ